MPLSADPQIASTSSSLVSILRAAAPPSTPQSFRPAHAKGHLLTGTFHPTPLASTLSSAPHFNLPSTPITLRFSSSTGIPNIPDTDPRANPRGLAIRFHLPPTADGKRKHTDVITHSTPLFPVKTGEEFLALLTAAGSGDGEALSEYLKGHPETGRFLGEERKSPVSFFRERFWGVNAFKLMDGRGGEKVVRYRVVPVQGHEVLSDEELLSKSPEYLYDDLREHFAEGKGTVGFKFMVQIAGDGDVVDDATVLWGDDREVVELGEVRIEGVVGDGESAAEERVIIFDPVPRVEGLGESGDPLVGVRADVYLRSGRQRRDAV